ncbi:MAG: hypothetical protein R3A44_27105 [Caldilineaceae bacterium]
MSNPINRMFFGALIALMAGISFGVYMLPQLAYALLPTLPGEVSARMAPYLIYTALLWAPWGAVAGRRGGLRRGVMLMGLGGLIAGAIYSAIGGAAGGHWNFVVLGAAVGALYGAGAGALLGGGFPPMDEKSGS